MTHYRNQTQEHRLVFKQTAKPPGLHIGDELIVTRRAAGLLCFWWVVRCFAGLPRYNELLIDCRSTKVGQFPEQRITQATARRFGQIIDRPLIETRPKALRGLHNQRLEQVLECIRLISVRRVIGAFCRTLQGGLNPDCISDPSRRRDGSLATNGRESFQGLINCPSISLQSLAKQRPIPAGG